VLDGVGQRLGHDEVGGRFELRRHPLGGHVHGHRRPHARHQRLDRGAEPAAERRREDPVGELAKLLVRPLGMLERVVDELDRRPAGVPERA
jgi:hypothetical protein